MRALAATHEVRNQSRPFEDVDVFALDLALAEGLEHARRAERNEPRLRTHDRFGHRIDDVELDPSWHWLLRGAVEREIHSLPWRDPQPGAHVARAALELLWTQADAGVMCPVSMTYSAVPALRADPE